MANKQATNWGFGRTNWGFGRANWGWGIGR